MSTAQERIALAKAKREEKEAKKANQEPEKRSEPNTAQVVPAKILNARLQVQGITDGEELYSKRWLFMNVNDTEYEETVLSPEQKKVYLQAKSKREKGRKNRVRERVRKALFAASLQRKTQNEALNSLQQNEEAFLPEVLEIAEDWLSKRAPGIVGYCPLVNVGNSCYMNACLQLLFSIPELKAALTQNISDYATLDLLPDADIDCQKDVLVNRILVRTVNGLFLRMDQSSHLGIPVNPRKLLSTTKLKGTDTYTEIIDILRMGRFAQEDADEFINRLFSRLFCFQRFEPLKNLFTVIEESSVLCKNPARNPPPKQSPLILIQLEIEAAAITSVQSALTNYQLRETFTEDNKMLESCAAPGEKKGEAQEKQLNLRLLPTTKYLFLNLKRNLTDFSTMQSVKQEKPIELNPTITVDGVQFQLRMCIRHTGTGKQGHYESFLMNERGHPIIRYNDDTLTTLAEGATEEVWDDSIKPPGMVDRLTLDLLQENATVLLYEKVPAPVAPAAEEELNLEVVKKGGKRRKTRKLKRKAH